MTAVLQKHHTELQNYLTEWSNKQQQLLDMAAMSCTSPTSENCISQQELQMKTVLASNIMEPASASEFRTAALAEGHTVNECQIEETVNDFERKSSKGSSTDSRQKRRAERGVVLTTAGKEKEQAKGNDDVPDCVEKCRSELANNVQVSLNHLNSLTFPLRSDIQAWLTATLDMLTEEISKLDLLELPDLEFHPDQIETSKSVLVDVKPGGIRSKIQRKVGAIVRSDKFESLSAIVILLNAIVMGIAADYKIRHLSSENIFLKNMEMVFFSYYTLELFLRIIHNPRHFCFSEDWMWNWFDFGLVVLSASDHVPEAQSSTMNVSFLRLLRLLKMVKLLRVFRLMKMFRHLRLILASIFGSMCAIFWAGMLVIIVCYMASLLFVNLVTTFLMEAREQNKDVSSNLLQDIETYWGSVSTGMNSLFGATTGGEDWFAIAAPLQEVGNACYFFFLLYMGFFLIVILNTFSSLFVQSVLENQEKDAQAIIEAELEKKEEYIAQLQDFYDQIDDDGDGAISMAEFVKHADDPKLHAWAHYLGIDLTDAKHFFEVLSHNGALVVDIEAFVVGCIKLKGNAKSVDVMSVFQTTKQIQQRMDECYLLLHARNSQDKSSEKRFDEFAKKMYALNPLRILAHISSTQEKMLALTSMQAERTSSSLHL